MLIGQKTSKTWIGDMFKNMFVYFYYQIMRVVINNNNNYKIH